MYLHFSYVNLMGPRQPQNQPRPVALPQNRTSEPGCHNFYVEVFNGRLPDDSLRILRSAHLPDPLLDFAAPWRRCRVCSGMKDVRKRSARFGDIEWAGDAGSVPGPRLGPLLPHALLPRVLPIRILPSEPPPSQPWPFPSLGAVAVCGGELFTQSGTISYPGAGAAAYDEDVECIWLIHSSPGNRVVIQFE